MSTLQNKAVMENTLTKLVDDFREYGVKQWV